MAVPPRPRRHDQLGGRRAARAARRRPTRRVRPRRRASPSWRGRCWPRIRPRSSRAIDDAIVAGIDPEELGRAVAYAAALRITRFHTQNDHGDWDEVHHAFTSANALHQAIRRAPTPELLRGVYHGALRVYLDRFLNVPAARLPEPAPSSERRRACRPVRAPGLLGPGGPRRRGRRHRLPLPARRRRPGAGHRRARPRAAERGRRVPLVPDLRGRRPPVPRLAGGLRGGRPDPRRHGPVPRRPHADPPGAVPGGPHRHPFGPRRGAVRVIMTESL